jgi:hypothetical protein
MIAGHDEPGGCMSLSGRIQALTRSRAVLAALVAAAAAGGERLVQPGFFALTWRDGHLYGSVIDILNRAAPVMLVALGMTVVIATRGIDISVGAVVAISGGGGGLADRRQAGHQGRRADLRAERRHGRWRCSRAGGRAAVRAVERRCWWPGSACSRSSPR